MEYRELLGIVQQIEKDSAKPEFNFVDIMPIAEKVKGAEKRPFREMITMAMGIESSHIQEVQQKQRAQQPKTQILAPILSVQKSAARQPATAPQEMQVQQVQGPQTQKADQKEAIRQEITSFLSRFPKVQQYVLKPFSISIKKSSDFVLLKLSIADQISELEKIIEGLTEHIFSEQQIRVIRAELLALRSSLDKEERSSSQKPAPSDPEQVLMLGILRNQRLDEALAMLGVANGPV
jgi:hypothetical protein